MPTTPVSPERRIVLTDVNRRDLQLPRKFSDEVLDFEIDWTGVTSGDPISGEVEATASGGVMVDANSTVDGITRLRLSGGSRIYAVATIDLLAITQDGERIGCRLKLPVTFREGLAAPGVSLSAAGLGETGAVAAMSVSRLLASTALAGGSAVAALIVGASLSAGGVGNASSSASVTVTRSLAAGGVGQSAGLAELTVESGSPAVTLRDLAVYDVNFAEADYKGGIQPDTYNPSGSDNRFFRVSATQTQPSYYENKDGSLVARSTSNTMLRRSDRGVWIESNISTNHNPILWTRDLTNAVWVKAGCTAFKDQTGRVVPAVANTASRIVVDADGATVLQTTASPAPSLSAAFDIRRISGSGTVEFTLDGVTWTAINPTATMRQHFIPLQAVGASQTFGFRFGTAGDQFEIDMVRASPFPYAHTPLVQTDAARRQYYDRYTTGIAGGSNGQYSSGLMEFIRDNAEWGLYCEWFSPKTSAVFNLFGLIMRQAVDGSITCATATGSGVATEPGVARISGPNVLELNNRGLVWTIAGTTYLCVNGSPILSFPGTSLGPYTALDHKDIGSNGAGTFNMDGVMPRIAIIGAAGLPFLAANAQAFTTPVDYVPPAI